MTGVQTCALPIYFEHSASWLATFLPEKVVNLVGTDGVFRQKPSKTHFAQAVINKSNELMSSPSRKSVVKAVS
mgnify:CR=1 FL=1